MIYRALNNYYKSGYS